MRLLFDHTLSPRLVRRLVGIYPDTGHVFFLGMAHATDGDIWQYARKNDWIIVTKDADFSDVSVLRGFPPKVIWLRLGNCTTDVVERVLRQQYALVEDLQTTYRVAYLN